MGAPVKKSREASPVVRRWLPPRPEPMVLTARDRLMVHWVYQARLATCRQLAALFFGDGGDSRCHRRSTLLYRNRFVDKLPDRPVNLPDIYFISGRCINGLKLLRALSPETPIHPHLVHSSLMQHTLEMADCHIAFRRAAQASGFSLPVWLGESELSRRLAGRGLLPDAYFSITRTTPDGPKTASFFLELERSARSDRFLTERIRRYRAFYTEGGYEELFHTKALRILVLFGAEYGVNPQRQIQRYSGLAEQFGVTFFRLASLKAFLDQPPEQLLGASLWHRPGDQSRVPLFSHDR